MGILFAFLALACWGIGDFLIQRSTRKFGDWVALFYITAFATVVLFPFLYRDLGALFVSHRGLVVLFMASIVVTIAGLLNFEALRVGKISVMEPIYAFEVPVTAFLAAFIIGERLTPLQTLLVIFLVAGIFLVSTRGWHHVRRIHAERGVWYAVFATVGMGATNFLFGLGARETNPLLINWFTSAFITAVALAYLAANRRLGELATDWRHHQRLILSVGIFDNAAWVAFAYSVLYIPIAISTSISEAYIALAALLGLIVNREKLERHQKVGLALAVVAVIALAAVTDA
jgi:drug/metabolite transporter (DMT)-like permease